MIEILLHLHKYVPSKTVNRVVFLPDGEEVMNYTEQKYSITLLGGDQLTAARARGAQRIRSNSLKSEDRLEGILPVSEDWHTKMCLLQVNIASKGHSCGSIVIFILYIMAIGYLEPLIQDKIRYATWNTLSITKLNKSS